MFSGVTARRRLAQTREHALVIGGSLAGLLAARVLSDHFQRVTLIERDELPEGPEPRKGVPQARHIHILLVQGLRILAHLFPELEQDLIQHDAVPLNWSEEMRVLLPTGWTPCYSSDLVSYACSRDLLEWLVRRRVKEKTNIRLLTRISVAGLIAGESHRVQGVRLQRHGRGDRDHDLPATMAADLVVDASGRSSKLPEWLVALGFDRVQETVINAQLGYATRWYQAPPGWQEERLKAVVINPRPPHIARGGGMLPAENGQWVVTLAGIAAEQPPTDEAAFMAFLQSLPSPILYDMVRQAQPLTPIYAYRRTENRWRHYERLRRWPPGIIAIGDAVSAFNPVYGQGMTVSALSATLLDRALHRRQHDERLGLYFQTQLARVNQAPWLLATGEDFRWPTTTGGQRDRLTRIMHRYVDQVLNLIPQDTRTAHAFLEVMHLLAPPTTLFHPAIMAAVLWQGVRRRWRRPQPPQGQISLNKEMI